MYYVKQGFEFCILLLLSPLPQNVQGHILLLCSVFFLTLYNIKLVICRIM